MEIEILKEIGLSSEENKIYLTLLKEGSLIASSISKKTGINRSLVYQILDGLIGKGFVGYIIRENIRYYNPVSPDKILELMEEKQEKLKKSLPELKKLFNPTKNIHNVEILEGKEGIKTILRDILKIKQEWFAFGSGKGPGLLDYYPEHWEKERVKNKIHMKALLDSSDTGLRRSKALSKLKHTEIKILKEKNSNPSSIWIYGDRVSIITWSKENPFGIRIISNEISQSYKRYFNNLWRIGKKYKKSV